jgi:hypothetical protein
MFGKRIVSTSITMAQDTIGFKPIFLVPPVDRRRACLQIGSAALGSVCASPILSRSVLASTGGFSTTASEVATTDALGNIVKKHTSVEAIGLEPHLDGSIEWTSKNGNHISYLTFTTWLVEPGYGIIQCALVEAKLSKHNDVYFADSKNPTDQAENVKEFQFGDYFWHHYKRYSAWIRYHVGDGRYFLWDNIQIQF